jgi:hypothetical protein
MRRFFNIAGPCNKIQHYIIDPATRLHGVENLIEYGQYFVIHAARQSGKTTYLQDLAQRLNAEENYYTLYCSLENLQGITNPKEGIPEIVRKIKSTLRFSSIPQREKFAEEADYENFTDVLQTELTIFSMALDKPLVILFDEADCLSEGTLITFLRQLRNGYNSRSTTPFVHSVALVGMRNIRDFKAHIRSDSESLGSASPFNIVAESLTIKNFSEKEIVELYAQHTAETGQVFEPGAIETVWRQTLGQPWLVNAIAREVIVKELQSDFTQPVTAGLVEKAIQTIILRRDVHIDSLLERLKEPRVRRVIEPMMLGEYINTSSDDFLYTRDLGLIRVTKEAIQLANPIYAEVIVRTLNNDIQQSLQRTDFTYEIPRYLKNGKIDMTCLMQDFQQFWRENSAIWGERFLYKEAAPHLILMAFLQRVINGGGQIIREMAAEKGRLDICVVYEGEKYPIELKIWRGEKSLSDGLTQTARYMDTFGVSEGGLALFDRRPDRSWDEKIYTRKETVDGKTVTVVGL